VTPEDVTVAIREALLRGGQQWIVLTIAAFMPSLWCLTLILHLARPYMLRTLRKLSLRLGADVWWLSYVLLRDAMTIVTFSLSFIFLMPDLVLTMHLPLTAPLATLCLFLALYVKLMHDADDDLRAYRLVTALLVVGATLYFVPQTFGIEASSQDYLGPLVSFFDSTQNQTLARPVLLASLAGFAVIAVSIFWRVVVRADRRLRAATAASPAADA
jgi:hypothetical protein